MIHNIEAEKAVLAGFMTDSNVVAEYFGLLTESAFYLLRHRYIFRAMSVIHNEGRPIDPITVSNELDRTTEGRDCGGLSYLRELLGSMINPVFTGDHVQTVLENQQRRKYEMICKKGLNDVENGNIAELIEGSQSELYTLDSHIRQRSPVVGMPEASKFLNHVLTNDEVFYETGFSELDSKLEIGKGHYVVIGAYTSAGKTSFATQLIHHFAHQGEKCFIVSLEMTTVSLMKRLLSLESNRTYKEIRQEIRSQEMQNHLQRLESLPINFLDRNLSNEEMTINTILSEAKKQKLRYGLDVMVVDHARLVRSDEIAANDTAHRVITDVSKKLMNFARKENVLVILLSQIRRKDPKADPEPVLDDLKESGSMGEDADSVMLIYKPTQHGKEHVSINGIKYSNKIGFDDTIKLKIEKQRNGYAPFAIPMVFIGGVMTFRELETKTKESPF